MADASVPPSLDLRTFSRDLDALNRRVADLRTSRLSLAENDPAMLDAALLELETAEEELRAAHDELESSIQQMVDRSGRHDRERQLLRQVFRHVPFGLFILDASGAIRQANPPAAAMTGTPLEFLAGKPLPVFISMASRAAFRSHLAAVLRNGRSAVLACELTVRGHPADVRLALSRLTGPDSERPLALAAAWTNADAPAEAAQAVSPPPPPVAEMADASLRLDVMGRMTRLLLSGLDEAGLLPAAAQLLAAECADWAIIDLLHHGKLVRRAVAGPRGPLTTSDPDSELTSDVMDTGGPVVLDPIEDEAAFGHTPEGAPILAVTQAGSLVSVGLARAETIVGALTLIRREDRPGFSLADAALFAEVGTHIAIVLGNRGMLDDVLDAPRE
jgi:phosphoserine phosphatase RsbU/P